MHSFLLGLANPGFILYKLQNHTNYRIDTVNIRRSRSHLTAWIMLALLSMSAPAYAETSPTSQWALCKQQMSSPVFTEDLNGKTVFSADSGEIFQNEIYELYGNIIVERDNKRFMSDNITYFSTTEQAVAIGKMHYETEGLVVHGENAQLQLDNDTGTISNAHFSLPARHGRGSAKSLFLEGTSQTRLRKANYTTCDPHDEAWKIKATDITLNYDTNVGTARNAVLSFMKIPFFYTPYITFPLNDDRKSGFLTPSFGTSSKSGKEIALPYYFNIAPNYDATLTPNYYSKRGLMVTGQFRYLTNINSGELNIDYLYKDKVFDDKDRGAVTFTHKGNPAKRVSTLIDYNYVSDADYLNDFGRNISKASQTHLPQRGSVKYQGDKWTSAVQLQDFQTVDKSIPDSSRPYQLLPKFTFETSRPEMQNKVNFDFKSELVNFQRQGRVNGKRFDIRPKISLPISNAAAYFKPAVKYEYTRYSLSDQAATLDDDPDRSVPFYSIDSGIFLEKEYSFAGKQFLNTIEPRLYYLYVPFRDQSDIPVFDSGSPDFNYNQLFRDNRFTSVDRVGDTNQITAAITTRLLNDNGVESLKMKVGQIFYFSDREVSLNSNTIEDESSSDIVSEATVNITDKFSSTADMRWDTQENQVDKGNFRLRYHPGYRRIVNLSYRYRNQSLQQTDMSLLWPISLNWHVIGRWVRSFLDSKNIETLAGFEYQNCCWKFNFLTRRYIRSDESYDTTYFLQLEFKGLTRIGQEVDDMLKNGILGYEN